MSIFHLGIDVAKNKLDCALRRPDGTFRSLVVANTPIGLQQLSTWLKVRGATSLHACMESTGTYGENATQYLAQQGHIVSVVNPLQIKSFGLSCLVRSKTDRIDARLIATFCHERKPSPWQPYTPSEVTLRAFVLRLEALQTMRTQESNRLEVARADVRAGIKRHLKWLDGEIKKLDIMIEHHLHHDAELQSHSNLLLSIPGLGQRTVPILLAFISPLRFAHARQVAAFAGLDPRHHQSGSSVLKKVRISRIGHAFLRKSMYMPAMTTLYKTDWGKLFFQRLDAAGKPPKLIIGAMMRKLLHVAFGVLKSGLPFNQKLHLGG
jgi:transposase